MSVNHSTTTVGTNTSNVTSPLKISEGIIFDFAQQKAFDVFVYPFSLIVAFIIVGLIGNCVVLYVFSFRWRKNKNTVFILTLAIIDMISCSINMPVEAAILYNFINFDYHVLCTISRFTTYMVSATYSFVLVAIAIDRYLMVCRPFKGMTLDIPYATRTCVGAVVLSLITQWPSLVFYGTYTFNIYQNVTIANKTREIYIEAKTCLVSNYYVEHHTYLYAFYAFLFIGHVIIFISFISVYMHIGRRLFMSSQKVNVNDKQRNPRLWRMSVVSALTGAMPKNALCSKGSRTLSSDNVNAQDKRPHENNRRKPSRQQSGDSDKSRHVYIVGSDERNGIEQKQCAREHKTSETEFDSRDLDLNLQSSTPNLSQGRKISKERLDTLNEYKTRETDSNNSKLSGKGSKRNSARESLRLTLGFDVNDIKELDTRFSKASSSSTGSEKYLLPMSPMTATPPDSSKPMVFRRSMSEDLSSRFSVGQMSRKLSLDIKEISLKQNTLIMRMVTFCFILSYLPFLVLVCIRYTHPHIPGSLSGVELIIYHVFLRSYFFNSVIRPFIYIFMNDEYRKKVWNLFRCRLL